jgi:hypothetical protein
MVYACAQCDSYLCVCVLTSRLYSAYVQFLHFLCIFMFVVLYMTKPPFMLKLVPFNSTCSWCLVHTGNCKPSIGRAMAQAVSRRPLTADARVRSRVSPCGICGLQSGTGTGFFPPNTSVFPVLHYSEKQKNTNHLRVPSQKKKSSTEYPNDGQNELVTHRTITRATSPITAWKLTSAYKVYRKCYRSLYCRSICNHILSIRFHVERNHRTPNNHIYLIPYTVIWVSCIIFCNYAPPPNYDIF